ncbi:hypothetical protein KJA15_01395 [Patescibacteria group bacterium]|nr:hypothetical protein [Patescibacteria group bacterium]
MLALALMLLLSICLQFEVSVQAQKNKEKVKVGRSDPKTCDPALDLKQESDLVSNVYETLLSKRKKKYALITKDGLEWSKDNQKAMVEIKKDVKFHGEETLTAEDVKHSLARLMIMGLAIEGHNTAANLLDLLIDKEQLLQFFDKKQLSLDDLKDEEKAKKILELINEAIKVKENRIIFHFKKKMYTLTKTFHRLLKHRSASIMPKSWLLKQSGEFPGLGVDPKKITEWVKKYGNLLKDKKSPLDYNLSKPEEPKPEEPDDPKMNGTGPWELDFWEPGIRWRLKKFEAYHSGWPAEDSRGYCNVIEGEIIPEWSTRKLMFLAGDLDIIDVPRMYAEELFGQPGIRCVYPLPTFSVDAMFFNFKISTTSPYMGVPGGLSPGTLDESGIPPDFFSDIDVRKAFAYSFDYDMFIEEVCMREAYQIVTPIIPEILGYDQGLSQFGYYLDFAKAEEHFRSAWGGQLWANGFTMAICYELGNIEMGMACQFLEMNIESLNPKFHIDVVEVSNDFTELPVWFTNMFAGSTDPHNFISPFMYSYGTFAVLQGYNNSVVDELVEKGEMETDLEIRKAIYSELQEIYIEDCPSVPLDNPLDRHWERDWVQGWDHDPLYPGIDFYPMWKEDLPAEDLNSDGSVDIFDIVVMAKAFGSYYLPGESRPEWNSRADLKQDQIIDIFDVVVIAKQFGYVAPPWTPPS